MNSERFPLPKQVVAGLGTDSARLADAAVAQIMDTTTKDPALIVSRTENALILELRGQALRISLVHVYGAYVSSNLWFGEPALTLVLRYGSTDDGSGVAIVVAPESEKKWFEDAQRRLDPIVPGGVRWTVP